MFIRYEIEDGVWELNNKKFPIFTVSDYAYIQCKLSDLKNKDGYGFPTSLYVEIYEEDGLATDLFTDIRFHNDSYGIVVEIHREFASDDYAEKLSCFEWELSCDEDLCSENWILDDGPVFFKKTIDYKENLYDAINSCINEVKKDVEAVRASKQQPDMNAAK
jgi:hypothetical protein